MGKLVVLYGTTAGGKSTVQKALKDIYKPIITATTRPPRNGEIDGVHYHFLEKDLFLLLESKNMFIETNEYLGNYYGTLILAIQDVLDSDDINTIVLDINGTKKLKEIYGDKILAIYIGANIESLVRRFKDRNFSQQELVERTYKALNEELQQDCIEFGDAIIWNNDGVIFDRVLKKVKEIIEQNI